MFRSFPRCAPSIVAVLSLAWGCVPPSPPPDPAPLDPAASTLTTARPFGVLADGTDASQLQIRLVDTDGEPLAGSTVELTIEGSASRLTAAPTDAQGKTEVEVTSTQPGKVTYGAEVLVDGGWVALAATASVEFRSLPADPGKSSLTVAPATLTAVDETAAIEVVARDALDRPIPALTVTLTASGANNTLTPASGTTDAEGVFRAALASTRAEVKTVGANLGGVVLQRQVTFVPSPDPSQTESSLAASPLALQADGVQQATLVVTVRDAGQNPMPGQAVSLEVSGTANTLGAAGGTTDASGQFSTTLSSTRAEVKTVTATCGPVTLQGAVTFRPGNPVPANSTISVSPSSGVVADGVDASTITVTLADALGNPTPGVNVSSSATGSGHTFSPAATGKTDASGVFVTRLSSTSATYKNLTVGYGYGTFNRAVTFVAGPPAEATTTLTVGPLTVEADGLAHASILLIVRDAYSNPVPNHPVTLSATGTGNRLRPPSGATDAQARFFGSWSSTVAEAKTLTATMGTVTKTQPATFVAPACVPLFPGLPSAPLGLTPGQVFAADLDQDGHLDLVAASEGKVVVVSGSGRGTFGRPLRLESGSGVSSHAALPVDLNGDGHLDLVVSHPSRNEVATSLANGDGSFGAFRTTRTGTYPYGLRSADLDADGLADVVVTNFQSGTVGVLLGNGDGTFEPHVGYSAGSAPRYVAIEDFSGDGQLDLAVSVVFGAGSGSGWVSLLTGKGDGTFNPAVNTALNHQPTDIAAGDFNKDGRPDVALPGQGGARVAVLLNNGTGGFAAPVTYTLGSTATSIAVADLDGDGNQDLAVAGGTLSVLPGTGTGTFGAAVSYGQALGPTTLLARDLDEDGRVDLAYASSTSDSVAVVRRLAGGGFPVVPRSTAGKDPRSVALGDFTGDGALDALVGDTENGSWNTLAGDGVGGFGAPVRTFTYSPARVTVGDWNKDGKLDLAGQLGLTYWNLGYELGTGSGTFTGRVLDASVGSGAQVTGVASGDVDGDGNLDVVASTHYPAAAVLVRGRGDGTFQAAQWLYTDSSSFPDGATIGDFNGDGRLDLAVRRRVFLNDGLGGFTPVALPGDRYGAHAIAADVDADGKVDLVSATLADWVTVALGNGDGTFQPESRWYAAGMTQSLSVVDVTGDGRPDLVTANGGTSTYSPRRVGHSISVLPNLGGGAFGAARSYPAGLDTADVALADLDGDGRVDAAAVNRASNVDGDLATLFNEGCL